VSLSDFFGDYSITDAGTRLSGLHIRGSLNVNAADVAVSDCIVDGSINLNQDGSVGTPPAGQTFTRVRASSAYNAYGFQDLTFDLCQFTAEGSGEYNSTEMQMRSYTSNQPGQTAKNLTVRNSYFGAPPHNVTGSHLQAIHLMGVQGALIQNNNMEYIAPDSDTKVWVTAVLYCENYDSECQDITIDSNRFRGGGYYCLNFHGSRYVITDNDIDPDYAGGFKYPSSDLTIAHQAGNTCGSTSVTF